jgi:hypothetical protein
MVQNRSRKQKRTRQRSKSKTLRHHRSRSRSRSRSQRAGAWYNPVSWFSSEPQYYSGENEETIIDKVGKSVKSGLDTADTALANASTMASEGAQKLVENTKQVLNTDVPLIEAKETDTTYEPTMAPAPTITPSSTIGGRRRRSLAKSRSKSRSRYLAKKGGSRIGVAQYASPVEDIKMAQPTYVESYSGGKKRRTMKRGKR